MFSQAIDFQSIDAKLAAPRAIARISIVQSGTAGLHPI
jgi:hypothetical protein